MLSKRFLQSLLITSLACAPALASADTFDVTLNNPVQTGPEGTVFTYSGTILAPLTNTGTDALLGDNFTVVGSLTVDDTDFGNTPVSLDPGQSYTGDLFTITAPAGSGGTTTTGLYSLTGEDLTGNQFSSNTADFSAQVTAATAVTPEPSSLLLLMTGVLAGGVLVLRRGRMEA